MSFPLTHKALSFYTTTIPKDVLIAHLPVTTLVNANTAIGNTGIRITGAPLVIGMGPGSYAGREVQAAEIGKVTRDCPTELRKEMPDSCQTVELPMMNDESDKQLDHTKCEPVLQGKEAKA